MHAGLKLLYWRLRGLKPEIDNQVFAFDGRRGGDVFTLHAFVANIRRLFLGKNLAHQDIKVFAMGGAGDCEQGGGHCGGEQHGFHNGCSPWQAGIRVTECKLSLQVIIAEWLALCVMKGMNFSTFCVCCGSNDGLAAAGG